MRKTTFPRFCLVAGMAAFTQAGLSLADDTNAASSGAAQPASTTSASVASSAGAPVKLPYGVEDVLKLSRAQIGENIILNYVQSSGTIYNLAPKDIVYLHDQGVSDKVINAMLDQRKRVEMAAQATSPGGPAAGYAPTVGAAPTVPDASTVPAAPSVEQSATYAEAPLTPPASSVYVIPYPAAGYAYGSYYYPYSYYGPSYYGWYGPSVVVGLGFGGHRGFFGGHGGFHGGFHGGHGSFAGHGGHR